ncbi:MAG: hypothetical protein EOM18_09950 [Clostridia bacterium]|nr:hypothetical protein [Clostridia bacterium]
MRRELIEGYYDTNERELEAFIKEDAYVLEMEKSIEQYREDIQPVVDALGHEFWTKLDRLLSARSAIEAHLVREMYIRGFLDYERLVCERR